MGKERIGHCHLGEDRSDLVREEREILCISDHGVPLRVESDRGCSEQVFVGDQADLNRYLEERRRSRPTERSEFVKTFSNLGIGGLQVDIGSGGSSLPFHMQKNGCMKDILKERGAVFLKLCGLSSRMTGFC